MAATLSLRDHLRAHWRNLRQGRPGRRFQERYERARQEENRRGALKRLGLILLALLCFAIGVVLAVMPGPAIVFFFLSGGLLATESRVVARAMDALEVRLRQLAAAAARIWRRTPKTGRIAAVGVFVLGAIAVAYLAYRWFFAG
jgi:hypothetical protein